MIASERRVGKTPGPLRGENGRPRPHSQDRPTRRREDGPDGSRDDRDEPVPRSGRGNGLLHPLPQSHQPGREHGTGRRCNSGVPHGALGKPGMAAVPRHGLQDPRTTPGQIMEKKLHTCNQECWDAQRAAPVMENPVLKQREAIFWKAFEEPEGEDVLFCPTCYLPIHLGEGPFNARGYRAELLRRLFPDWFKVTENLFKEPQLAA